MTSSAAADGVGARRSATKSQMVKSVSWPTAEITGSSDAAIVRANPSSLNAAKSSSDPPPRATTITSTRLARLKYFTPALTSDGAEAPCTCAG